ncbi:MAG TPA: hypothetical protein VHD56_02425 [Tepidisphaeraceae bacterium]|nr:hypothetical protein [Tepidisphaeraceae bacterium]
MNNTILAEGRGSRESITKRVVARLTSYLRGIKLRPRIILRLEHGTGSISSLCVFDEKATPNDSIRHEWAPVKDKNRSRHLIFYATNLLKYDSVASVPV